MLHSTAKGGTALPQKRYAREGYLKENYHYFHLRDTAGQERDFHFHEFDKVVLLISGRVDYALESSVYALRPWDILLVKHHAIHKALIDKSEPYERVILYLDRRFFDRMMPDARLFECFDRADERALSPGAGRGAARPARGAPGRDRGGPADRRLRRAGDVRRAHGPAARAARPPLRRRRRRAQRRGSP